MNSPIATISRPLILNRGKRFSSAAPTITAENFSPPLSRKRRKQKRRRIPCSCRRGPLCLPKGRAGTPLALSHGFYNTVSGYVQSRFHESSVRARCCLSKCFRDSWKAAIRRNSRCGRRQRSLPRSVLSGKIFELAKPANVSLWNELCRAISPGRGEGEDCASEVEVVSRTRAPRISPRQHRFEQLAFRFSKSSCSR